ncbi:MAG: hypothetical protein IJA67_11255 [Oscillospiraceae bacterium]|nr:hypothetical protein [Oscillospiraceae bacterium]
MSILEDLELLDLTDASEDDIEFDLDDILFEFSTPGLFDTPEEDAEPLPQIIEEDDATLVFAAIEDPAEEAAPAAPATEEPVPQETIVIPVITEAPEDFFSEDEEDEDVKVMPEAAVSEDTSVYHGDLLGDPFGIGDILYEFGTPIDEEGVKVYAPEAKDAPAEDEEDIKVYIPEETVPFTAVEDLEIPEAIGPAPAALTEPPKEKGPGLLTKAAAAVMGLLGSFKKKPAKATADTAPADPFAHARDLFEDQMLSVDDLDMDSALMLELEVMAEMEAEREAKQAAWEAEEHIMDVADPIVEVPAAIAALQREAEEEALRKAAEEAALRAAEEEELQSVAQDELFDWIESTNKLRRKPAEQEDAFSLEEPAVELAEEDDVQVYVPALPEEDTAEPMAQLPALSVTEEPAPTPTEYAEEESSAEILSLLENPDTQQEGAAVSAEAEEDKISDDDLRYVPEEAPAKAIGSHIGKKFNAVMALFTAAMGDEDEDALGAEVTPTKAYRFFNKFINDYRFRVRLSAVLCVISAWIALGLPVFGSLRNPATAATMCMMLLLTVMLAGADILARGFTALLRRQPTLHSLVFVSCIASVIDALVIISTKGKGGYLPFCAVSAISVCFAIYGSLLYCRSQRLNFKTLEQCAEPLTISVDYGIVDEETTTVYRTIGHPEQYIHRSEEEDLAETVYGLAAPLLLVGIPVLSLLAALLSDGMGDFFHILAAMYAAAPAFSALLAFPLPYFLTQRDLYATKSAIAGWTGTKEIGRVSTMIVTDRDLFPDETVVINSIRIVDGVNPELTMSYFCSMIKESGSCLVPAFEQLAENNDCELRPVEEFQCHEAGGLSGMIGPDEVLIASHSYMKLQGFRIPARKKDSENALFMAVNGHVIAYIVMDYKPIKSVRAGLESALRGSVEMVFAARDFNITPLLISKKFKSPTDTLRFPSYKQRYEITSHADSDTAVSAAVVSRKSFFSYAAVVEKARYLYRSVTLSVALSAVSSVMGIVLMFIMALTGAGSAVTVGRLLIFMLLWLVPTLALTVSITK